MEIFLKKIITLMEFRWIMLNLQIYITYVKINVENGVYLLDKLIDGKQYYNNSEFYHNQGKLQNGLYHEMELTFYDKFKFNTFNW